MLLVATRVLLAVLLTISSPAWCACAFASEWSPASVSDGCGDSCCPAAEFLAAGDEMTGQPSEDPDRGLPCRDQSDCSCCDAGAALTAPVLKEVGVPKLLLRAKLAPTPAVVARSYATAPQGTPMRGIESRGVPPPLTAAGPLLLRGCLLLT